MIDPIEPIYRTKEDHIYQSKAYQLGLKRKRQFKDRRDFDRIFKEVREKYA